MAPTGGRRAWEPARLRPLRLASLVLPLLAWLTAPSSVLADCADGPPLAQAVQSADIVFVGTVTATQHRETWATVVVHEVWRGPSQPVDLVIRGGPGGNSMTSVDRVFEAGVKYLFFPYVDSDAEPLPGQAIGLSDNNCSSTTPWAEAMLELRPAEVIQPVVPATTEPGIDLGGLIAPTGVALVVAAALLAVGLLARGRQSS